MKINTLTLMKKLMEKIRFSLYLCKLLIHTILNLMKKQINFFMIMFFLLNLFINLCKF